MSKTIALHLYLLLGAAVAFAQATARIQGTVSSDDGKPLAGVYVGAYRTQPLPAVSAQALSAASGSFDIQNLPAGNYTLCGQMPGGGFLDPCHWSIKKTQLTLAAGQLSTNNQLQLRKGSLLKVRLNDPGKALAAPGKPGGAPPPLMGVWSPTTPFYPLSAVGNGADYQVTIPYDLTVRFLLNSNQLRLADSTGAPIAATGFAAAVRHNSGDPNPPSLSFTVTGVTGTH